MSSFQLERKRNVTYYALDFVFLPPPDLPLLLGESSPARPSSSSSKSDIVREGSVRVRLLEICLYHCSKVQIRTERCGPSARSVS